MDNKNYKDFDKLIDQSVFELSKTAIRNETKIEMLQASLEDLRKYIKENLVSLKNDLEIHMKSTSEDIDMRISKLISDLDDLKKEHQKINAHINQQKGGDSRIMYIVTILSAIIAIIATLYAIFS